jgi:hypothetical protein
MKIEELLLGSEDLVNKLADEINLSEISLKEAEVRILEFVNRIGQIMTDEVVEKVKEPTVENILVMSGGEVVRYHEMRGLRFINRFGGQTVRLRRCYRYKNKGGGYYPLDEKLGLDLCGGEFSPLLSYLQAAYGSDEPFEEASKKLSEALGFSISATAVQNNTEKVGFRMSDSPYRLISDERRGESCDVMLVEMDGTLSPQILEIEGITGRESLKLKTEYKEANVVVIEKYRAGELFDRWIGARYGPRKIFEEYLRRAALQMGQMKAEEVVFGADGTETNWDIQRSNFPGATTILDFYHASEHLAKFCDLFNEEEKGKRQYKIWAKMLLEGERWQVIAEMKESLSGVTNTDKGWGEINYFQKNVDRMKYDEFRSCGLPIGTGLVEGACKYVIGKRFKGSGMRWKKTDNESVLKVRLAKLNARLHEYFVPKPQEWTIAA